MPKKKYTTLPKSFSACIHADCPMAASCLRQVAYSQMMGETDFLNMVNPRHCSKDSGCKFYREAAPARYALGFKNFQKCMLPEQYREFMSMLMEHFGRGGYFYRRRGVIAMPPAEQEIVLNALHAVGIREDIQFDAYEELINWFD